jgi:hypothetical protein
VKISWFPVSLKIASAFPVTAPVRWSLAIGEAVPIPSKLFVFVSRKDGKYAPHGLKMPDKV